VRTKEEKFKQSNVKKLKCERKIGKIRKMLKPGEIIPIAHRWNLPSTHQLYVIGQIADGSCFYHSICYALIDNYQSEERMKNYMKIDDVYRARQKYVDIFRRGLAQMITYIDSSVTEDEVKLNIKIKNIDYIMDKYVRTDQYKIYENKDDKYKMDDLEIPWEVHVFHRMYIIKDKDIYRELAEECVCLDPFIEDLSKETAEDLLSNLSVEGERISPMVIEDIKKDMLLELEYKDRHKLPFEKYIKAAYSNINNDVVTYLTDCNVYERGKIVNKFKWVEPYIRKLFFIIKNITITIKYKFGDKKRWMLGKWKRDGIKDIKDIKDIKKRILSSYTITGERYNEEKYRQLMNRDPREDFSIGKDDILWKLPLNTNYFKLMDFSILDKIEGTSLHISSLSSIINSYGIKGIRNDAGYDDIIALIPEIVGVNIHFLTINENGIKVYESLCYGTLSTHIVLKADGVHFEVIGCSDSKGDIQTVFSNHHPFIQSILEYNKHKVLII
jgi:hypothetical protein